MLKRSDNHIYENHPATVSLRWTDVDEAGALAAVAARDSRQLPAGPWLVAEVEDQPLAALSLATGEVIADPFSRTTELRSLLELRAMQLRSRVRARRRERDGGRHVRSRAALAASPPGAGGRLLTLAPRPRF